VWNVRLGNIQADYQQVSTFREDSKHWDPNLKGLNIVG
jgi:hypothetical protein